MSWDKSRLKIASLERDDWNLQTPLRVPGQSTEEKVKVTKSWSEKLQGKTLGQSIQRYSELDTNKWLSWEAWL